MSDIWIYIVNGVEGPSVCLSADGMKTGLRVAGPKPHGGGKVGHKWQVDADRFLADVQQVREKSLPKRKDVRGILK